MMNKKITITIIYSILSIFIINSSEPENKYIIRLKKYLMGTKESEFQDLLTKAEHFIENF